MLHLKKIAVAATALILCNTSSAVPHYTQSEPYESNIWKRQEVKQPDVDYLEPVVPPGLDESLLSVLAPAASVSLTWAGSGSSSSANATKRRIMKRDGAVFARAALKFKYPAVTLDHSAHIVNVTCSKGRLDGVLDEQAYRFAKKQWSGLKNLIFITAADTCGPDDWNDYFNAISVTFVDATRSFTATQSPPGQGGIVNSFDFVWGDVGAQKIKRTVTKQDMFHPHLQRRWSSDPITWKKYLHDDDFLGADEDAPWENAALLREWKKGEDPKMKEDDSYKKGEVSSKDGHHKRSNNSSVAVRGTSETEFDYGLALYCVDCGTEGDFVISGTLSAGISGVTECSMRLHGTMQFGLNLGLNAYVKYSNDWKSKQKALDIYKIGVPGIATFSPYIGIQLSAGFGFEASGQILLGATAIWDDIDMQIDLASSSNSHANGLVPRFEKRAEAKGELEVTAYVGLPIELGVRMQVGGFLEFIDLDWEAAAGVRDTPKINFKGGFEVSAELLPNGTVEYDINGGCYGLAWNVFFTNDLDLFVRADGFGEYTLPIIEPYESPPIAQGCIGYVKDSSDDGVPDGQVQGSGTGSGVVGNGMNSANNGFAGGFGGFGQGASPAVQSSSTTSTRTSTTVSQSSSTTTSSPIVSSTTTRSTTRSSTTTTRSITTTSRSSSTSARTSTTTAKSSSTTARSVTTTARSSSTTRTSTTTTKPPCTPSPTVNAAAPTSLTCKKAINRAVVMTSNKPALGTPVSLATVDLCAGSCLKDAKCLSFSYTDKQFCQLYNVAYKSLLLGTTSNTAAPQLTFFDRQCYANTTCPK